MTQPETSVTYHTAVRDFNHWPLTRHPAYFQLREALSDFANQAGRGGNAVRLGEFLEALRDMAVTSPFADNCERCEEACTREHRTADGKDSCGHCGYQANYPYKVERTTERTDWILCSYRCPARHEWNCGYSIDIVSMDL